MQAHGHVGRGGGYGAGQAGHTIRILDNAADVRVAAATAVVDRTAAVLDASGDDGVSLPLVAALARVRACSCEVSPHDRSESMRFRIADRQQWLRAALGLRCSASSLVELGRRWPRSYLRLVPTCCVSPLGGSFVLLVRMPFMP